MDSFDSFDIKDQRRSAYEHGRIALYLNKSRAAGRCALRGSAAGPCSVRSHLQPTAVSQRLAQAELAAAVARSQGRDAEPVSSEKGKPDAAEVAEVAAGNDCRRDKPVGRNSRAARHRIEPPMAESGSEQSDNEDSSSAAPFFVKSRQCAKSRSQQTKKKTGRTHRVRNL